ncbi:MAG: DUF1592 domain-containing protein [bacterium]|nr:DUF1592 domain-containing protein [bacterium]
MSILKEYCAACHSQAGGSEAELDFADWERAKLQQDATLLEDLIQVIADREMPPADQPQLTTERRERLLVELRADFRRAAASEKFQRRTPMRRMNRFQYNNAVVDLFDLNCVVFTLPEKVMRGYQNYFQPASGRMPESVMVGNRPLGKSQLIEPRLDGVAAFPQDLRAEHGYDNQADHLSLSPLLMDEFLKLGQSITQSPDFGPKSVGIWQEFFAAPEETVDRQEVIRERLRVFLTRAFRRPAEESLVARYTAYAMHTMERGASFSDAMKAVAAAAIASPRFLYIYEKQDVAADDGSPSQVDDLELAARLAFFLWGSIPDDELLALAQLGELSQPQVLDAQIARMLTDVRLKRFCDSFPVQWLQLDRMVSSIPDPEKYPDFYFSKYRMSMHMMLEPLLLFETVLIENLPITQFVDSDFTYRSAKLEQAYGRLGNRPGKSTGGGVTQLTYRRVPVSDRRSGGLITNAAVMTMTSGPERTKPITRGAWVAGVILNDPPEPPPADVPPLAAEAPLDEQKLTLRQRLVAHREREDCRGCHEQIDPLGFALENYDAVGVWRDQYDDGLEIDASGTLFGQYPFTDVLEFKDAILANKDRFCRALAGHLLSFALARELGPADQLALDEIVEAVSSDDYRMRTMMRAVILSDPFRMK